MLLVMTFLVEVLMYRTALWWLRVPVVVLLSAAVPALSVLTFVSNPSWISALVIIFGVTRVFNYLRIAKARMHEVYLRGSTRRTGEILIALQLLVLFLPYSDKIETLPSLLIVAFLQLFVAIVIMASLIHNMAKSRYVHDTSYLTDKELPTVTVAIPARNETTDLEACLTSVLASNYPKLEIIVLDDCSQVRTSEIIKSYAHNGVRFIKGAEPDDHWLAKNQGYARLAEEASGELILFCGVDVRFGTNAIRALVTSMTLRQKKMISVMPRRLDGTLLAAFIQPMRYWWEVALPRRLFNRPPVLSTAWIVQRDVLEDLGGFAAVSRKIIPEAFFARELVIRDDSYSFMRASSDLDIQTAKSVDEQWATAVRVRYPQIHRRPEMALVMALFDSVALLGPIPVAVAAYATNNALAMAIAATAAICLVATHVTIVQITNPANSWLALFNLPVAIVLEMIIGTLSMIKYEFGSVEWKDRNICIPVMHESPRPRAAQAKSA